MRGVVLGLLAVPLLAALAAGAFVWSSERSVLFPARRAGDASALLRAAGAESAWLEARGVRSEAWFLPARGARTGPVPLLVFAHGNGELVDDWPAEFDEPRSWGVSALLVEYPGYGRSGGSPSQASITAAMVAAFDWASARPEVDRRRIVAYGRSVGGGAACALARQREVAALVLESSFTSLRSIARRLGVPGFLVRDPFDNLSFVAGYRGPLLLVHGARDDIVPVEHAHALHAAAPQSELLIFGDCGHNDCPRPWPKLKEFLASHDLLPGS